MNNSALKILYLFNGIFVFAAAMLAPLYAIYAEELEATIFQISLLAFVFLSSKVLFTFLVKKFGDEVLEKEYLLLIGFAFRAFAWILLIFVSSVLPLFLIQILLGIGEAFGNPSFNAIFAEHLDKGKHIKEYAEWGIIGSISAAVGTLIGGAIVTVFGFNILFITMSFFAIVAFIGVYLQPRSLL